MTKVFKVIVVLFIFVHSVSAQKRQFTYDHILDQVSASNPQLSSDGKWGLYTLSRIDFERNRRASELICLDISTNQTISLGEKRRSQIKWIPGSNKISYLSFVDGKRQIFEMSKDGKELKQVTRSPNSISRYSWSPDGRKIALIIDHPEAKIENKFNDAVILGNNDYLVDETPKGKSIYIYNIENSKLSLLSPEGWTVGTGLSTSGLHWSEDGSKLAYDVFPSAYSGDSDRRTIYISDLESGGLEKLTEHKGMESSLAFGQDGQTFYFKYKRNGQPSDMSDIFSIDLESRQRSNVTSQLDQTVNDLIELSDGSNLLVGFGSDRSKFWRMDKAGKYTEVDLGDLVSVRSYSFAPDGSCLMVAGKMGKTQEVFYWNSSGDLKQVTSLNAYLDTVAIGRQESISWKSSDGLEPNGIVTYPPGFDPSKKYPLVVYIHGGPTASSKLRFDNSAQLMAAKGWVVFQPNYRGSNNLGNSFQSAIANDPSEGPGHDVITGVDYLKSKSFIDSERVAVSGWSYGGWMTAWLIGRYPDVWRAAVAGAAPVDFTDMYSLNDLNRMLRHSITRSPYVGDNLQWSFDNSPMANFSKIKVPTLIMSKISDSRVTITGSYKLYGALRDNKIPVEFIGYPGPGHFPSDPVRSKDVWDRWIAWIEKYLSDKA